MIKRRRLNKALVIETAAALANRLGSVDALSLKALAAELDIRVPSLYNHIDGMDGLQRDLTLYGARLLLTRLRQAILGKSGREAIMAVAAEVRAFAYEQPAIYPLTIRAPEPDETELIQLSQELIQILLLLLTSFGLQGDEATHAIRGLRALIHGFITIDLAEGYKMALDKEESFSWLLQTYLDGLERP
ncbi:MAG: WHG domain-containing protein [Anaerolineales bacterium]|nr:WHG domain-containing protein [Anaerolineales bacterium]